MVTPRLSRSPAVPLSLPLQAISALAGLSRGGLDPLMFELSTELAFPVPSSTAGTLLTVFLHAVMILFLALPMAWLRAGAMLAMATGMASGGGTCEGIGRWLNSHLPVKRLSGGRFRGVFFFFFTKAFNTCKHACIDIRHGVCVDTSFFELGGSVIAPESKFAIRFQQFCTVFSQRTQRFKLFFLRLVFFF